MEYEIKFKRKDTGKWWGAGRVKQGQYGPSIGMRKTPELKAYLDAVEDGGWINFALFEPYDSKEPRSAAAKSTVEDDDSSIPF